MGMGIKLKLGNGNEWEFAAWEWEGMGMYKSIVGRSSLFHTGDDNSHWTWYDKQEVAMVMVTTGRIAVSLSCPCCDCADHMCYIKRR